MQKKKIIGNKRGENIYQGEIYKQIQISLKHRWDGRELP